MLVLRVCGVRQNLYVYSLYRNPDLDDRIFDCLLASMAAVQAEDARASFLFVGDLNGHHQEWLGSMTTNRHGVAAFDFATVSGCDQLVVGPTHAPGSRISTGCCCSTDRELRSLLSVGRHFDGSGSSKLVCEYESFPETSSQLEYSLWCNRGTALA